MRWDELSPAQRRSIRKDWKDWDLNVLKSYLWSKTEEGKRWAGESRAASRSFSRAMFGRQYT